MALGVDFVLVLVRLGCSARKLLDVVFDTVEYEGRKPAVRRTVLASLPVISKDGLREDGGSVRHVKVVEGHDRMLQIERAVVVQVCGQELVSCSVLRAIEEQSRVRCREVIYPVGVAAMRAARILLHYQLLRVRCDERKEAEVRPLAVPAALEPGDRLAALLQGRKPGLFSLVLILFHDEASVREPVITGKDFIQRA